MPKQKNRKNKGRYFEKEKIKSENAPQKILMAARKVFAQHPFNVATTRMIAKEAGVDHPLIHYYFGSKERLFETVSAEIFEEFNKANEAWLEGLERMPPREGFSLYLDRLLDYSLDHPEPFQMIALNMMQAGKMDIPGYEYIIKNIEWNQRLLEKKFPLLKPHPQTKMLLHSLVGLVISYMGAKTTHGKMLGMDPQSPQYREWVKEALYLLFFPWLEKIMIAVSSPENAGAKS